MIQKVAKRGRYKGKPFWGVFAVSEVHQHREHLMLPST
jgi:hypothetical protein